MRLLFLASVATALLSFSAHAQNNKKPNIIFILADDLGYTGLGCTGSDLYQTPNLDNLYSEGMYFSEAYSSHPTCMPSRMSILTGKYPARMQCTSHGDAGFGIFNTFGNQVTIAEALRDEGYVTCHVGKWHLGKGENEPINRGFDYDIASNDFCCVTSFFYPYVDKDHKAYEVSKVPDLEDRSEDDFLTEALTDEAVKFINGHKDEPFFLNLWYYAVHTPIQAEKEKVDKYKKLTGDSEHHTNAAYAGLTEHLDDGVGKVLKALEDNCIADNTIVIFVSDNGGETVNNITSNHPLKNGKNTQYEGGYRVPMIIKWPGATKPGSICNDRVIGCDFYPTMLTMAGAKGNSNHNKDLDGVDLTPVLKNPDFKMKERSLHWLRYLALGHYKNSVTIEKHLLEKRRPCASIIENDWKLIKFLELPDAQGRYRLYDLKSDPYERNDLAAVKPRKVLELEESMMKWQTEVNAPSYKMEKFYGPSNLNLRKD